MRKRRQRLQVSTFPFLAVLLCTMGSLLLLLLVIDRQAKAVARRKALLAVAKAADDRQRDADRQAEWERRRRGLQELRRRERQTYSLVPYKGKRGDNRRPLYLECTTSGVVFHPDRLALEGADNGPDRIRAEVERRIAGQRAEAVRVSEKGAEGKEA